jgi:hypothetical protein
MASDKHATDPFLAAVEAKIAAWKAVADSYKAAVALDGPLGERGGVVAAVGAGALSVRGHAPRTDLPVGVFRGKTIKEAIAIYLGAVQRKQTNKEIAIGLKNGGIATTAANFEATVATALYRLKEEGVILRFNDGWDLAASYPDSLRGRLEKDRKPRPTRKAKAKTGPLRAKVRRRPTTENTPEDAAMTEPLRAVV